MSTAIPPLIVIALLAAIALCGVGIWAAVELGKAARSSRRLAEDLDERVPPLADKLDVSVDAFNAELLRVDLIVDQLEGAVDRFTGTAETVREVVDAPIHLVSEVADRFRHGFRRRGSHARRGAQPRPAGGDQAEVVLLETSEAGETVTSAVEAAPVVDSEDSRSVIVAEPSELAEVEIGIETLPGEPVDAIGFAPSPAPHAAADGTEPSNPEAPDNVTSSTHEPEEA